MKSWTGLDWDLDVDVTKLNKVGKTYICDKIILMVTNIILMSILIRLLSLLILFFTSDGMLAVLEPPKLYLFCSESVQKALNL